MPHGLYLPKIPGYTIGKSRFGSAVKANGDKIEGGNLFTFKRDGTLYMCAHINPDLGFRLNREGEIVTV